MQGECLGKSRFLLGLKRLRVCSDALLSLSGCVWPCTPKPSLNSVDITPFDPKPSSRTELNRLFVWMLSLTQQRCFCGWPCHNLVYLHIGTRVNLLDPKLWKDAEQPWPPCTPATVLHVDAYTRAATALVGRMVHVFAVPLPADIVKFNSERNAHSGKVGASPRGDALHGQNAMGRDHIPSTSYVTFCVVCIEFVTLADYHY